MFHHHHNHEVFPNYVLIINVLILKSMRPETVWYSSKYQKIVWIAFKNGKTQLFNSGGVVKWAYFQKKVEYPFNKEIILAIDFSQVIYQYFELSVAF